VQAVRHVGTAGAPESVTNFCSRTVALAAWTDGDQIGPGATPGRTVQTVQIRRGAATEVGGEGVNVVDEAVCVHVHARALNAAPLQRSTRFMMSGTGPGSKIEMEDTKKSKHYLPLA
jgi:hypothetical protein